MRWGHVNKKIISLSLQIKVEVTVAFAKKETTELYLHPNQVKDEDVIDLFQKGDRRVIL